MRLAPVIFALALLPAPAIAQETPNPQVDYGGFADLVGEVADYRQGRLLEWTAFAEGARSEGAILLDTRSAADFARGHLSGAVNLPFSEFTDAKLRAVIGEDRGRPIYIYCNNNFADNTPPVVLKRAPLALNIPTFVNLYGYGYRNVWELGERVTLSQLAEAWVTGDQAAS